MADNIKLSEVEQQASVPYFVHEGTMARMERVFRIAVISLVVALALSLVALLVNDARWRHYCTTIEDRYNGETSTQLHEQSDTLPD